MIDALAGLLLLASVGPVEAADLIWSVDLESDDAGFSAAGETGQWEWDQVTTGPVSCFTGTTCWATLPQGAYLHEATDYLVFPSLDLTGTSAAILTFEHWMHISPSDVGTIEAQIDGTWTTLQPAYGYPDASGYSSSTEGWETVFVSLAGLGDTAALRLSIVTATTGFGWGWYVDDFAVYDGDIVPPSVSNVTELPDTEDVEGPYVVSADVVDDVELLEVRLEFSVDGGTVVQVSMTDQGGGTWEGAIPGQASGHDVTYWVVAEDEENQTVSPEEGWNFSIRLAPPTDLEGPEGLVHAPEATLTWVAPDSIYTLEGYGVYRDEVLVAEVTGETAEVALVTGRQDFAVSAFFDVGESPLSDSVEVVAAVPEVRSVSPSLGYQGDTLRVEVVTSYVLMVDGDVTLDLGEDVTVDALEVRDVDTLVATLSIDEAADPALRDVTITTSEWEVTWPEAFELLDGEERPRLTDVTPADVTQGESAQLIIEATHDFASVPIVSLGEGIVIEQVSLVDGDTLEVDVGVAWDAPLGERVVEVDDGVRVLDDVTLWVRDYVVQVPRGWCSTTADPVWGGGWLVALLIGFRRRQPQGSATQESEFVNASSSRKA